MSDDVEKSDGTEEIAPLSKFGLTVLYQPRKTLRSILEMDPAYLFWLIPVLPSLAALPGGLYQSAYSLNMVNDAFATAGMDITIPLKYAVILVLVTVPLAYLGNIVHIYGFAWVYTKVGNKLGGRGTMEDLECACSWSFAPLVVLRFVSMGMAFFTVRSMVPDGTSSLEDLIRLIPQMLFASVLTMGMWGYVLSIHVNLLAEAHRFSRSSGLALFIITIILYILVWVVMLVGGLGLWVGFLYATGRIG